MRKLTHAEQVAAIAKVNPDVEILGEIINGNTKVLTRCKVCGYKWEVIPQSLKSGKGCPKCAGRLTSAEQVAAIAKINPNVEILGKIINTRTKVLCRCKVCHHEWNATPDNLKHGKGCPACAGHMRLTHKEQIEAIAKVNPNVEVLGEIINNSTKVLCRCKICGYKWNVTPNHLKHGYGCPECAGNRKLTHYEHVASINKVNPNVEILGEITGVDKKVLCRCKICGHKWFTIPSNLKQGRGCPRCAKYGFHSHNIGKLYIMVDDLNVPTMMKIGVSVREDERSKRVLQSAHRAGVSIPALHVAKTWEGPTDLMQRIESMMHENYAEWNIKFPAKFDGSTEFFYYTPETAGVFDAIEEIYYTVVNQF